MHTNIFKEKGNFRYVIKGGKHMEQTMPTIQYVRAHFPAGLLKDKRLEKRGCSFGRVNS